MKTKAILFSVLNLLLSCKEKSGVNLRMPATVITTPVMSVSPKDIKCLNSKKAGVDYVNYLGLKEEGC